MNKGNVKNILEQTLIEMIPATLVLKQRVTGQENDIFQFVHGVCKIISRKQF
jgi:hypothetical protein